MARYEYCWSRVVFQRDAAPLDSRTRQGGWEVQEWLGPSFTNYIHTGEDNTASRGRSGSEALQGLRNIGQMFSGHYDFPIFQLLG